MTCLADATSQRGYERTAFGVAAPSAGSLLLHPVPVRTPALGAVTLGRTEKAVLVTRRHVGAWRERSGQVRSDSGQVRTAVRLDQVRLRSGQVSYQVRSDSGHVRSGHSGQVRSAQTQDRSGEVR